MVRFYTFSDLDTLFGNVGEMVDGAFAEAFKEAFPEAFAEKAKAQSTTEGQDTVQQDKLVLKVPGFGPEHVDLSIEGTVLNLKLVNGERKLERSYRLSPRVNPEAVTAKVEYGILTIQLPLKEDAPKNSHKVPVQ